MHSHAFWQLEVVLSGPIAVALDQTRDVLLEGDMLLIPPGIEHAFLYETPNSAWFTVKFECSPLTAPEPKLRMLRKSGLNDKWRALLETVVPELGAGPSGMEKRFVEGLLLALCSLLSEVPEAGGPGSEPALVKTVMERVLERGGKPMEIQELAEQLGYTRGYLSALFRSVSGESLKGYIDRTRVEKAKELLLYSEQRIAEVAETLGFKDLYAFSRFFKNGAGVSPRAFRQRRVMQAYRSE